MPTLRQFEHCTATTVPGAARLAGRGKEAAVIAGGTDLLGILKDGVHPGHPRVLVDIKPIAALRGVREDRRGLRIGALCTLDEVARHEAVKGRYPLLAQAANGKLWNIKIDRDEFYDAFKCRDKAKEISLAATGQNDDEICGICIAVCPAGRK